MHMLFTDTDSLMLEVETKDFYQDMEDHKEWFDLSFYPPGHQFRHMENEKVLVTNCLVTLYCQNFELL